MYGRWSSSRYLGSSNGPDSSKYGVWARQPSQRAYRRPYLANDYSHDDESGLRRHLECASEATWVTGHVVRELAGEAVFDGTDRMGLLSSRILRVD